MKYRWLGIPLLLFLFSSSCQQEVNPLPGPLEAGWKGKKVCQVLSENEKFRVLKCTFEPGVGHERHQHPPHFGYTLSGSRFRIKDTTGIREVDLPSGYHFENDGVAWHEVQNIGDSTSVYLIFEPKN